MLLVADVHGAFDALAGVARRGETLLILGDLINFVDYRTGAGIAREVFGEEFATQVSALRAKGDFASSRALWRAHSAGRDKQIRQQVAGLVHRQYREMGTALQGARGYVIHGNVDVPALLEEHLPDGMEYVDARCVEIEGNRVGFVGGGAATGLNAGAEKPEETMRAHLAALGPVDILCTHQAPAVAALQRDVITGRLEGASAALLDYIVDFEPAYHYFGDVHQPQASVWRVGATRCINVGYFRATHRALHHG